jgi:hypothetical protein
MNQQTQEVSKIVFGNPNQSDLELLQEKNYLDIILSESDELLPFENDSDKTRFELHEVIAAINSIKGNEDLLQRYYLYDNSLLEYIQETLSIEMPQQANEIMQTISDINADISPLLVKLKYKFQRPRPYQLGHQFKVSLYPFPTISANSPSYPSGHAFQARIVCEVLGNKFPQFYNQLLVLAEDIANSRICLGVHYKSDIEGGFAFAEKVLMNKEFQKKYGL